jgi:hypothetical protein
MRRPYLIALIVFGAVLFLVISALLARALSVGGAEQAAITSLVEAEARGDSHAMAALIKDCGQSPACQQRVAQDAAKLARKGRITILQLNQSAGFSVSSTVGTARVAWRAGNGLPVVQCVRVRRAGDVLSGLHVELLEISAKINGGAYCPRRY